MTPQKKTALTLFVVSLVMLSLSFAAVPFYRWFCQVTGFAGTPAIARTDADQVLDRTMKIRFDASVESGMPWQFKPQVHTTTVRIGQTTLAFYEAYNPTDEPVAGQASYNVVPDQAGGYFTKIECFCFTEQVLQPNERIVMPVSFYVDPSIVDDPEATQIHEITLSYTFHQIPLPQKQAALAASPVQPIN